MKFSEFSRPDLDVDPALRAPRASRSIKSRIIASVLILIAIASGLIWKANLCPRAMSLGSHLEEHRTDIETESFDDKKPRPRWLLLGYGQEPCGSGSVFSNQGDKSTWCINVPTAPHVPERVNWYPGQYWKLCTWNSANCTGAYSSSLTGQGKCQSAVTQSYMVIDARRECFGLEDD